MHSPLQWLHGNWLGEERTRMSAVDVIRGKIRRSIVYDAVRGAQLRLRSVGEERSLPSFIVIGAQKAGTTSFYANLTQHPQIFSAWTKEVHYFDQKPVPKLWWYKAHFPRQSELKAVDGITGEASPSYSVLPQVPNLINEVLPACKFIFLLREPVARAYSAYQFNARRSVGYGSFEDWIERDFRFLERAGGSIETVRNLLSQPNHIEKGPVGLIRGVYIEQLKNWRSVFPESQILVLDCADYFANPSKTLTYVAEDFLQCRPHEFLYQKTRSEQRLYDKIDPRIASKLRDFYKPFNHQLYEYLNRDLGWSD